MLELLDIDKKEPADLNSQSNVSASALELQDIDKKELPFDEPFIERCSACLQKLTLCQDNPREFEGVVKCEEHCPKPKGRKSSQHDDSAKAADLIAFHRKCYPQYISNSEEKFKCQICLVRKPKQKFPNITCVFCKKKPNDFPDKKKAHESYNKWKPNDMLLMSQDEKKNWSHLLCKGLYFLSITLNKNTNLYESLGDFYSKLEKEKNKLKKEKNKLKKEKEKLCKICQRNGGLLIDCSSCRLKTNGGQRFFHPICAIFVREYYAERTIDWGCS